MDIHAQSTRSNANHAAADTAVEMLAAREGANAASGGDAGEHSNMVAQEGAGGAIADDVLDFLRRDRVNVNDAIENDPDLKDDIVQVRSRPDDAKGRVLKPAATRAPRAESKTAKLLAAAQSAQGISNDGVRQMTGWTKLGGFFHGAKKAGLMLHRCKEDGTTRWFAVPADTARAHAYIRGPAGQWVSFGDYDSAEAAQEAAQAGAPDGTTVTHQIGKRGEVLLTATGDA